MSGDRRSTPRDKSVAARGAALIRNPSLNKGTGFPLDERQAFGIEGLLPVRAKNQTQQAERIYRQLRGAPDDLQKYVMLNALLNRNVHLYYRVLADHLEELMPIVYTPTVGAAVQRFSHVFQGGGGVWITPDMKGRMEAVLRAIVGEREIRLLVVTDNESILGIGDQGAGGMAISQGKLALYTAAAGIDPAQAIPVSLDFGTDNDELLADDQYLGWQARRLRGPEYLALVDEFVSAVQAVLPRALIQWEDFRKDNALTILDRYSSLLPSFNDDIQGTGAVVMAGLNSALGIKGERLAAQRIVIFGAGAAGLGVTRQIKAQLLDEGVAQERYDEVIAVLDRGGLLVDDGRPMDAYNRALAWPGARAAALGLGAPAERSLLDVVRKFRPTVLIGLSGVARAFNETIVREMAAHVERPVILPSSNPVSISRDRPDVGASVVLGVEERVPIAAAALDEVRLVGGLAVRDHSGLGRAGTPFG
jgi:malic enzyme